MPLGVNLHAWLGVLCCSSVSAKYVWFREFLLYVFCVVPNHCCVVWQFHVCKRASNLPCISRFPVLLQSTFVFLCFIWCWATFVPKPCLRSLCKPVSKWCTGRKWKFLKVSLVFVPVQDLAAHSCWHGVGHVCVRSQRGCADMAVLCVLCSIEAVV